MKDKLRWFLIGVFLFLSVIIDFSSKLLSIFADGALVAVAIALAWPLISNSVKGK